MARRRGQPEALNAWPGYVDALSTLLMVIIFVLLVFVLAQAFLSVSLSGREQDLTRLTHQMGELSDLLALERGHGAELQAAQGRLDHQLQAAGAERDTLAASLRAAHDAEARALAERDAARAARDTLASRVAGAQAQVDAARARDALLQGQLAGPGLKADATAQQVAATATELAATRRQLDEVGRQKAELDRTVTADRATIQARLSDLASAATELADTRRLLAEMQRQRDALDATVQVDRATMAVQLSDLAKLTQQVGDLAATRDRLTRQVQDAAVRATTEAQRRQAVELTLTNATADLANTERLLAEMRQKRDELDKTAQADRATAAAAITKANQQTAAEVARRQTSEASLAAASADLANTGRLLAETRQRRDELDRAAQADRAAATANAAKATQLAAAELSRRQVAEASLATARAELADTQRQLAEMRKQREALDATAQVKSATLATRLSELARLTTQVGDLITLRDRLAQEAADAAAKAKAEADRRGAVETQLAASNADAADLRAKLGTIEHALQLSEGSAQNKDVQITNLNNRLNSALAQKVEELQRYRSDFFGRMREVMANRPGIQVVGDRFVFQSEVLFPSGSAELSSAGHDQLAILAGTLADLAKQIPADVPWVLRVDGHADRQSVDPNGPFVDNLDLSAKRAINVVKLLALDGVPANRLAATAFGDTQPLDPAATPDAYARNRRIEIRLTDR